MIDLEKIGYNVIQKDTDGTTMKVEVEPAKMTPAGFIAVPIFGNPRSPADGNAVRILRRVKSPPLKNEWTKKDEEAIRWAGAISKCPSCGDRAYEHGYCFGCGRPLAPRQGERNTSEPEYD